MDKQRKIIHLHVKKTNEHHYFGSIKALCQNFGKQEIGIVYTSLKTVGLAKQPYENNKCIIRQGVLVAINKEPKANENKTNKHE